LQPIRAEYAVLVCRALPALGVDYAATKQGDWVARNFRFNTGEVLREVKLHYRTIGAPTGERKPVASAADQHFKNGTSWEDWYAYLLVIVSWARCRLRQPSAERRSISAGTHWNTSRRP